MQTEYDRNYRWRCRDDMDIERIKNAIRKQKATEPIMKHKRRVKLPEDNVLIGSPLYSQQMEERGANNREDDYFVIGNKNERFGKSEIYRNKNKNDYKKYERRSESLEKSRKHKKTKQHFEKKPYKVNESVQTDKMKEVSVQVNGNKKHPEISKLRLSYENKENSAPSEKELRRLDKNVDQIRPNSQQKFERHATEYNTKFDNKQRQPIRNPPLSDRQAENRSKLDTKLKIYSNFISEYQRQFKPYEYITDTRYKRTRPVREDLAATYDGENRSNQLKFVSDVRKRRALTPPPIEVNGELFDAHETRNTQNGQFPHGKSKQFMTEYQANYDNKWKKLDEQLAKSMEDELKRKANAHSKWFQEILDLRRKAQEYRQRSRGTHLSREHLGQVYTKRNRKSRNKSSTYSRSSSRDRNFNFNDDNNSTCYNQSEPNQNYRRPPFSKSSITSGSVSTIIGRPRSRSCSRSPERRRQCWTDKTAGKPSFDDNLLMDESASHDTDYKDNELVSEYPMENPDYQHPSVTNEAEDDRILDFEKSSTKPFNRTYKIPPCNYAHPERKYTFQKYFNHDTNLKNSATLKYDEVSQEASSRRKSISTQSIVSSSTMSLAKETLERARRNRDEILRQKV